MIIDCISDLHGFFPPTEGGDILLVGGDLTARNTLPEYSQFYRWLSEQNYRYKVWIAGNHDSKLKDFMESDNYCPSSEMIYLEDSGCEIEGLKIWGIPWSLWFRRLSPHCAAYVLESDFELSRKIGLIPTDTHILLSHMPGWGQFDLVGSLDDSGDFHVGSRSISRWLADHYDTLKLFVCGHIHEGHGIYDQRALQMEFNGKAGPVILNASHVDENYIPINKPIRVIL